MLPSVSESSLKYNSGLPFIMKTAGAKLGNKSLSRVVKIEFFTLSHK